MNLLDLSFSASEFAVITGLSTALQRDWRRREIMAEHAGQAKYDIYDAVEAAWMVALAEGGFGPARSRDHVVEGGLILLRYAAETLCIENPDLKKIVPGMDKPRAVQMWAFLATVMRFRRNRHPYYIESVLGQNENTRPSDDYAPSTSYFVVWADGCAEYVLSFADAYSHIDKDDPRITGAVLSVDMAAIGKQFSARLTPYVAGKISSIAVNWSRDGGAL
jgi:hypothetical protein